MSYYYPPLTSSQEGDLQMILAAFNSDGEAYLSGAPYAEETLNLIRGGGVRLDGVGEGGVVDIDAEVQNLYKELVDTKTGLKDKDNAEKMAYFRVATSLLEKLVGLRERANNVHQIGQFYGVVLAVMEEVLDASQVTVVRNKLMEKMG